MQQLPASPDAFVWLRLYQQQVHGLVPAGPDDPLWWTLRRPFRPLGYHAARAMFDRANAAVGTGWSLHDLRHTAAYRLARDPAVPIVDVQWILGHQSLSTTQIYVNADGRGRHQRCPRPSPAPGRGAAKPPEAGGRRPARGAGRPVRQAAVVTTTGSHARPMIAGPRLPSAEGRALRERFPPRPAAAAWDFTGQDRTAVLSRLLSPPFALDNSSSQSYRKFGLIRVLDWLAAQPGRTWQDRWNASGAGSDGHADWRPQVAQVAARDRPDRAGQRRRRTAAQRRHDAADLR